MCSRFYRTTDLKDLYGRYEIAEVIEVLGPQSNIAPQDKALIIPATAGKRIADARVFGIINPFIKEAKLMLHMRAESLAAKPNFRPYLLNHRCLVIANGFIEWERRPIPGKKAKDSHPYRFDLRNGDMMSLAGIWVDEGFAIVTTEPNSLVEKYQERMAVILRREDEAAWLDANNKDIGSLVTMLAPFPSKALINAELPKAISNSKNKSLDALIPLAA